MIGGRGWGGVGVLGLRGRVKIREEKQEPRWMMGGKREKYERGVQERKGE